MRSLSCGVNTAQNFSAKTSSWTARSFLRSDTCRFPTRPVRAARPMITNIKIALDRLAWRGRWHTAHSNDSRGFRFCAWQRLNSNGRASRQHLPIIAIPLLTDIAVLSYIGAGANVTSRSSDESARTVAGRRQCARGVPTVILTGPVARNRAAARSTLLRRTEVSLVSILYSREASTAGS